jgi:hypothetical protein
MISFKQFVEERSRYDIEREEMIESFLAEMPYLNKIPRNGNWSFDKINSLWDLVEGRKIKVIGSLNNESVVMYEQMGTRYIFVLKNNKPTFACSFLWRIEIGAWQEDIIAKDTSNTSVENLYVFLNNKLLMPICSSQSHSIGMKKVWLRILKKYKFKTFTQSIGDPESFQLVEPNNPEADYESKNVFLINKFK